MVQGQQRTRDFLQAGCGWNARAISSLFPSFSEARAGTAYLPRL